MADRQRLDGRRRPFCELGQRHFAAGRRRLQEYPVERRQVVLQARQELHDHFVARKLREILGDLALAEGVEERVVDRLSRQSVAGRLVAIESQSQRRARRLLVGGDVAQFGQGLQLGEHLRRPCIQRVGIGPLQSVLILGARGASADGQVLRHLHEQLGALDLVELRAQTRDDLIRGRRALVARLQRYEQPPGVERVARAADRHRDMSDGGILENDRAERHLSLRHLGEGGVLRRLRYAVDLPGVLLREEPLRDRHEQADRQREKREEDHQRGEAEFERDVEAALIGLQQRRKAALAQLVEIAHDGRPSPRSRSATPASASASATPRPTRRSSSSASPRIRGTAAR